MSQESFAITEMKLPVAELRIGMYVCRLDKPWRESSFLFQGFLIEDDEHIQWLRDECRYVYIDVKKSTAKIKRTLSSPKGLKKSGKSLFSLKGLLQLLGEEEKAVEKDEPPRQYHLNEIVDHTVNAKTIVPPKKSTSFKQEMDFAKHGQTKANELFKNFTSTLSQGDTIDMLVAETSIRECMTSMLRSPDAWLLMSHLSRKHHSIWQHSMNVSVLAISLGRCLNLEDNELVILGLCGMLHDIGNLLISKEMLQEARDKVEMKQSHTILGRDILLSCQNPWSEIVAEVAYSHHEFLNGTGYPRGLQGKDISAYTRIITIVDLYDKLTTDTERKKALTHYQAVQELLKQTTRHLDDTLVESFIQCIGTYPVGCVVEMNTGELAVVVEENEGQKLKPKVMLLSGNKRIINLANPEKGPNMLYEIEHIVRNSL